MFTPGPWRIGKYGSVVTDHLVGPADDETARHYGGHVICETVTPSNAALIAMAPELYEFVAAWLRGRLSDDYDPLIERADRLIAMAEGRMPVGPVI